MKRDELKRVLKDAKEVRFPISEEKTTITIDENMVFVPRIEYASLLRRSALLDALADDLKIRLDNGDNYPVKDDIVMAVTGANRYKERIKNEVDAAYKRIEELTSELAKRHEEFDNVRAQLEIAKDEIESLKSSGKSEEGERGYVGNG